MSYEPSHRKPPRQERWPNATPGEGWPAYQQGDGGRTWEPAEVFAGSRNGYGTAGSRYGDAWNGSHGYGGAWADGFDGAADGAADGYADGYAGGYADAADGYGRTEDYQETGNGYDGYGGWDGFAQPGHEFTGSAGYLAQDEYPALEPASSVLVAPDTMGEWWRQADRGDGADGDLDHRGPVVGAIMGFLAAAVAIGVATFAAAFVRPQASPASAVGAVLIDRLPATLRTHLMAHFGAHGQMVLLLGAIGLIAIVLGLVARRNPSVGVAGIAAFGLVGAFVAITRPESRASDVIPWAIGSVAGIMALMWLAHASAPTQVAVAPRRPASSGRRRTR
jgi:hypothetical protein